MVVVRASLFVALVALAVVVTGAPAGAQAVPTSSTTTTVPSDQPTTTTVPDPAVGGDAPPESVPVVPDTVPPRDVPADQAGAALTPPPATVVKVNLRGARASALARQAAWEDAVARRTQLEQALSGVQEQVSRLQSAIQQAVHDLAEAKVVLRDRAVAAYVRGNDSDTLSLGDDIEGDMQRSALMGSIVRQDREAVDRVTRLQAQLTRDQAQKAKELTDTQSALDQARIEETQAELDLFNAKIDLAVSAAGGSLVIHGFVFPVADPHTFMEDFGDPRLPDTEFAHTHEGCDVIADEGTELYATERGVITQISDSLLGGHGLWLKGESGTYYYYAHLSRYADGLQQGQLVDAGTLVGYVGHTGDAFGPHLHFEVHPGGGSAIDPYPILLAADQNRPTSPKP